MSDKWLICYLGVEEWDEFEGTLQEAIESAKSNRRHLDYGHEGVRIYAASLKYEVKREEVERVLP